MQNQTWRLGKRRGFKRIKRGYRLAAVITRVSSAMRDGKRLIAVVLGGPSTMARDQNVAALLDAGFDVLDRRTQGVRTTVAANLNEPADFRVPGTALVTEQGSGDDSVNNGTRSPRRCRRGISLNFTDRFLLDRKSAL